MFTTSQPSILAITSDAGILQHDIFGGIALALLLVAGYSLRRHQRSLASRSPQAPQEAKLDRAYGYAQLWAVYWLILGAAVVFFFVWPRATSRRAQDPAGSHTPAEAREPALNN